MIDKAIDTCETKIEGGTVIDGTGSKGYRADLAVVDDKIVAIGELSHLRSGRTINASGKVVAPGFIDAHTHDDRALMVNPGMDMKVSQGVTSVVVGNCGVSLAPLVTSKPPPPLDLIGDEKAYKYETFDAFLNDIDAAPAAVNAVFLVGHSTLRVGVMDGLDRPADSGEVKQMRALLEEGLEAGATGFSTGLFYAPAREAPTEEVIEISKALEAHDALYVTHMRDEGDHVLGSLEETFRIGREANSGVVVSHHKVHAKNNFGRSTESLACIDKHRHDQRIAFDVYPYIASSTVLKADSIVNSERVMITWSKAHPEMSGRDLDEIAAEWGCDIYDAADRLQPAGAIYFAMDEEDVRRILSHPEAMIGSDGLPHDEFPHPRLWGTFPRVLGHYSRDEGLFPMEEAVRRMTGLTAKNFGIRQRGELKVGNFADITVFDPETVIDSASFEAPMTPAAGIETVLVNGRVVWESGAVSGARPGRALRKTSKT